MISRLKYLRISVTDRCNLRCEYCEPGFVHRSHSDILSFEEIERIARAAAAIGVETIRLTGGEPLVRAGITRLFEMLTAIPGIRDLTFTTNGLLLDKMAGQIRAAGVKRFNLSLDTLDPEKYSKLTGGGDISRVLAGLSAARDAGFSPIKVNAVALRGINDSEACDFIEFAARGGYVMRFIELMKISDQEKFVADHFMSVADLKAIIGAKYDLVPVADGYHDGNGPAVYYRAEPAGVMVGFISPVSQHFCEACNRLRLTSDGHVKSCLLRPGEIDIAALVRGGASDAELRSALSKAFEGKERACGDLAGVNNFRNMVEIGG